MSRRAAGARGAEGFESAHAEAWGSRWPVLRDALAAPVRHAAWISPWAAGAEAALPEGARPLPGLPRCRVGAAFPPPPEAVRPAPWYLLDPASVAAAEALGVQPGHRVLDMAAAPGGKTLVLLAALDPGGSGRAGELVANDRSASRRARLHRVLDDYLPEPLRARVRVTGHDAARWGVHEPAAYDRVLLDAPCSSERHVLGDPGALAQWSPARSRQLARRQYAMAAAAFDALVPGGRMVYATCALSAEENDGVVDRLVRRRGARPAEPPDPLGGEATARGLLVLPDRTGYGPLYYAVLDKAG